jgi:hypothetical protein
MKLDGRERNYFCKRLSGISVFLIAWAMVVGRSSGANVMLAWNPSPSTNISGYAVYYGVASKNYSQRFDAGTQTSCTITGLNDGTTYYFAVTARADNGLESLPSNEISYTVPPNTSGQAPYISSLTIAPQGARLTWTGVPGSSYRVVYKTNLSDAQWIGASPVLVAITNSLQWVDAAAPTRGGRFYSVVLMRTGASAETARPYISSFVITSQGPKLTWTSSLGSTYRVVYKNKLSDPQWLDGSAILTGTGLPLQWVDTETTTNKQRFYSVVLLP